MTINACKKIISAALAVSLLYGQSFGQFAAPEKFTQRQDFTAVRDATRMASGEIAKKIAEIEYPAAVVSADISFSADRILKLNAKDLTHTDEFQKAANEYVDKFYNVAIGKTRVSKELYDTIYSAVLPLLLLNTVFDDPSNYTKISAVYKSRYNACIKSAANCDYDKAGKALVVLSAYEPDFIVLRDLAAVLNNQNIAEDNRIAFMQYAAPVMAQRGGRIYFEDIIKKAAARGDVKYTVTGGYVDPFILVKIADDSYQWVKEACSHKDGAWAGVCGQFTKDKTIPFRQYKKHPAPAEIIALTSTNAADSKVLKLEMSAIKPIEPAHIATSLRLYAEFYADEFSWQDTFKFIYNAKLPEDAIVSSHRDIALATMVINAPASIKNTDGMRKFFAARINNDYFALDKDEELDAHVKAALKDELGVTYAKLTNYKGQSPIRLLSTDGYPYEINFTDNAKEISGFWGSLFNFKDRPAEALTNVFIIGAITKGAVKNGDKIFAALARGFKATGRLFTNMPAVVVRAKANYRALEYLAGKNSMSTVRYAYNNSVYRAAAKKSAAAGMLQVEGRKAADFFGSSHYTAATHGNIGRISKDINRAASVGVQSLGVGGSVPSFIGPESYTKGLTPYLSDLQKQQQMQQSVVAKYRGTKLPSKTVVPPANAPKPASIETAAHVLPRSFLYSYDKARFLSAAQNNLLAEDYLIRNTIYQGLKQRGFNFINLNTAKPFGHNLTFHPEGYLQATGKVGLEYNGFTFAKESPLLGKASEAAFSAVIKAQQALAKVSALIQTNTQLFKLNNIPSFTGFTGGNMMLAPAFVNVAPELKNVFMEGETGLFDFAYKRPKIKYEDSVFKVIRSGGNSGSGFYIKYRGIPGVLSAGHVTENDRIVRIVDAAGKEARGTVLTKVKENGYDLAFILPEDGFLAGRNPFRLGLTEPVAKDVVFAHGYPHGRYLINSILNVTNPSYLSPNSRYPLYETTIGDITNGSSGGALSMGDFDGTVIGVAQSVNKDETNAYFVTLPILRDFLSNTARVLLFDSNYRTKYLSRLPDFAKNYSNILAKYGAAEAPVFPFTISAPSTFSVNGAKLRLVKNGFEDSVFKIRLPNGGVGSGFYINYNGIPAVMTAGHVVDNVKNVMVEDIDGKTIKGTVLNKANASGYDAALISVDNAFLEGRRAFTLASKDPALKSDDLTVYGFPNGGPFTEVKLNLHFDKFLPWRAKRPMFTAEIKDLTYGSSGSVLADKNGQVVGIFQGIVPEGDISVFTRRSSVREFLSATARKLLFSDKLRSVYLNQYPTFMQRYSNILGKYKLQPAPELRQVSLEAAAPTEEDVRSAVIKITRNSDGHGGSGFYINYRGFPVIVTASHVVRDDRFLKLYDSNGILGDGIIFNKTGVNEGLDIALITPNLGFLEGKTPLKLGNLEPAPGTPGYTLGFPAGDNWMTKTDLQIAEYGRTQNAMNDLYVTMPQIRHGNSGGPLILPSDGNKAVGIAHMGGEGKGYFITLPVLKKFLKESLIKKFLDKSFRQDMFLKEYPALAANYNNIISRYSSLMGKQEFRSVPVFEQSPHEIYHSRYFASADYNLDFPESIKAFGDATFKVRSLSGTEIGTGFYVHHRGVPMILTAGHVAKNEKVLRIADDDGKETVARVVASTGPHNRGYDFAMLITRESFLEGRKPLTISGFAPKPGERVFGYGYPEGGDFNFTSLTLKNTNFDLKGGLRPVYEARPALEKGYSGGPIANAAGKVVGMGHMSSLYGSYLATLPAMRSFIKETFIKELADPEASMLIRHYPAFANNYSNIIRSNMLNKYRYKTNSVAPISLVPKDYFGELNLGFTSFNFNNLLDYKNYFNNVKGGVIEVENSLYGRTGTGFYLRDGNREALLTAGHVVKGANSVMIRPASLNDKWFSAKVITYSLGNTDLGLLEIGDSRFWEHMRPLELAKSYPAKGAEIYSYGFPWGGGFEERLGIFKGFESGYEHKLIYASEHTAPGSSGGPVLYNGQVLGVCKEGLCTEQVPHLAPNARNKEPRSIHSTWEVVQTFLDNMVERRLPQSLFELKDIDPQAFSFGLRHMSVEASPSGLVLNPRDYGINNTKPTVDGYIPEDQYTTDFALKIGPMGKRLGYSVLTKLFRKTPRAALATMYKYGAQPDASPIMGQFTGEVYQIDNLNDYQVIKPGEGENWPRYPFSDAKHKHYLYRGMSLNSDQVANIMVNGIRKVDMPEDNMAIMSSMATPGTKVSGISMSPYAQESARYATVSVATDIRGIPMMVHLKDMKSFPHVQNPHGVFTGTDIPASHISRASVMLNINGKNTWGELTLEDGKFIFRPYK